jgi:hypothetical protein
VTLTKTKLGPYLAALLNHLGAYMDEVNGRLTPDRDLAAAAIQVTRAVIGLSLAVDGWTDADIGKSLGAIEDAFGGTASQVAAGTITDDEAIARLKALGTLAWPGADQIGKRP